MRRAGHANGDALFDAILAGRSGITFTADDWEDAWAYVDKPGHRLALEIPELLTELAELGDGPERWTSDEFPFVLSAGERRNSTANTIIRDPLWRKRDAGGALRISPQDAERLGLADGGLARVTTERGSAQTLVEVSDAMLAVTSRCPTGSASTPRRGGRAPVPTGVAPNELTSLKWRDPIPSAVAQARASACRGAGVDGLAGRPPP